MVRSCPRGNTCRCTRARVQERRAGSASAVKAPIGRGARRVIEKSAKFLPRGRISDAISESRTRRSVISPSWTRVFADNAVGEWATSPLGRALITALTVHTMQISEREARAAARRLSGGR